jgi:response regulator of citrate/malate metabolism
MRILILDDSTIMRFNLKNIFRKRIEGKLTIIEKKSVEEAQLYLKLNVIDLFCVDLHLPDKGGLEFIEWLLERGIGPSQILMVTASEKAVIAKICYEKGLHFLTKSRYLNDRDGFISDVHFFLDSNEHLVFSSNDLMKNRLNDSIKQ